MFLSIVIAAYNEEKNVEQLTTRIYSSLAKLKIPFELIYVIDGTDQTYEILAKMKKGRRNLILNRSKKRRGFRKAFVVGFKLLNRKATHVLTLDADLNHRPEEIGKFITRMKKTGADIVIGSRYAKGAKIKNLEIRKRIVSLFANFVIKMIWRLELKDKTSGYRLYKREVIRKVVPKCTTNNFEFLFEMLIQAKKQGYKLTEVPIKFIARIHGKSKFSFIKVSMGYAKLTFRQLL